MGIPHRIFYARKAGIIFYPASRMTATPRVEISALPEPSTLQKFL